MTAETSWRLGHKGARNETILPFSVTSPDAKYHKSVHRNWSNAIVRTYSRAQNMNIGSRHYNSSYLRRSSYGVTYSGGILFYHVRGRIPWAKVAPKDKEHKKTSKNMR